MVTNIQFDLILLALFQDLNSILIFGVAILLLVAVCGVVIWRRMFSNSPDYGTKFDESVQSKTGHEPEALVPGPTLENDKSFSSADTVTNNANEDIVENLERKLSSQKTVEVTGDPSISSDEEDETDFSNTPTVDATGDASISFEDDD